MGMKITICTGGFDPLHEGHLSYLKAAKKLGDYLIVGVNSNEWIMDKKGKTFMSESERVNIVKHLEMVDEVRIVPMADDKSCCSLIEDVKRDYPHNDIVFCNGGDRTSENIPEMSVSGVEFEFGVGGEDKLNSSSWLIRNAASEDFETRQWGRFYNYFVDSEVKVKELIVEPGKSLSYQRHQLRSELWFVSKGECTVRREGYSVNLRKHDTHQIQKREWHQLINNSKKPCHIIEIQYGEETREDDIERKDPKA
jgi:cytidyltransferase-like protein